MEETEELYSGSAIAARYRIGRSAVTNWIKRGVLPDECKPLKIHTGGARHTQLWKGSQLPALDKWFATRQGKGVRKPQVPPEMQEGIDHVLAAVEGQVFYSRDFPQALIISNDDRWMVRVSEDGTFEETYLSTLPVDNYLGTRENEHAYREDDLPELEGFTTGFTC